jgi:Flp pilus assembly CpaF family ATPase
VVSEWVRRGAGNGRAGAQDEATAVADEARAVAALREMVGRRLGEAAGRGELPAGVRAARVDELITAGLDSYARQALREARAPLQADAEARVRRALRDVFVGLAGLQPLLDDEDNETININGHGDVFVIRRDGSRARMGPVAASDEDLVAMLRGLGAQAARRGGHERRFDHGEPELSMQLVNGERLFALQDVTDRVSVSIRLHPLKRVSLHEQVSRGELTPGMAHLFTAMVRARLNIVVSGGPSAGKTTLLRALAHAVPPDERIITIEDVYELALSRQDHPDLVAAQARLANVEGAGGYDMSRLLRASLRMTPDRVIVGEVRGAEVVQMAKAMSIGIDGSMATVHASSSRLALQKLVTFAMEPPALYPRDAAMALVAGAVHIVIHLGQASDGTRVVCSVREVIDADGEHIVSNEVYRPGGDRRAVAAIPLRGDTLDQLTTVGFDPALLDQDRW